MPKKTETAKPDALKYYDAHAIEAVRMSIDHDMPALLIGDTGTGKTTLIREVSLADGAELVRINLTGQTGVDDIVGRWIVTSGSMEWKDGLLTRAMREGKRVVLDELNMALPEILAKLHSLMDEDRMLVLTEKDGEIVRPAEGFRLFGTMNPSGDYAGTKEMNRAFLSRFPIVLELGIAHDEGALIVERTGVHPETAVSLVGMAQELRTARKDGRISFYASTRDIIQASEMIALGMNAPLAVKLGIIGKVLDEEKEAVRKICELILGSKLETGKSRSATLQSYVEKAKKAITLEKEKTELEARVDTLSKEATKYDDMKRKLAEAGIVI
jgi:midasin (ATPase involved in ribosome maturation)